MEIKEEIINKKPRLGRGLSSLLGGAEEAQVTKVTEQPIPNENSLPRVWSVGIEKIEASQYQPRTKFDKEKLEQLAQSIQSNGILQPIIVRKKMDGKFEIVAGERRFRAAQMAGLHEVPVILKTFTNRETLELALIENLQREDLNAIESARAIQKLISEFQLTQQEVATRLGKDRSSVANFLRLLQLPESIQNFIVEGKISFGHAKALLSLEDQSNIESLAEKIIKEQLSVRALEKVITKKEKAPNSLPVQANEQEEKQIQSLKEDLQKKFGTRVSIDFESGKGKVSIHFFSNEEFGHLIDKLKE